MRRTVIVLTSCMLVLVTVAPPAVAADDGFVSDVFDEENDGANWIGRATGFVSGLTDRLSAAFDGEETTATEAADAFAAAVNESSTTLQSYVNDRTTADTDRDVLAVKFEIGGETTTRYLTADVTNGSYANLSVVPSTDRTVDETCTLSGHAARNAGDEIDRFVAEFASSNESVTEAYLAELAAEYGSDVSCTFRTGGS